MNENASALVKVLTSTPEITIAIERPVIILSMNRKTHDIIIPNSV